MCPFSIFLSRGLGTVLAVVMTTTAHGQQSNVAPVRPEKTPPAGSVHRMVIQEGPNRRVHYIAVGNLGSSDRLAAYELERAENQLAYQRDLQQLKQEYVNSERALEPKRRAVQKQLYGRRISYGGYGATYARYGGGFGCAGGYYGYPVGYFPFFNGGWGWGYGYPSGIYGSLGSSSYSEIDSLQYGMGNEGRMKDALIPVVAEEASPRAAAAAQRDYETAVARAAASPVLSRDLALPKSAAAAPLWQPKFPKGSKATIWVGNDKYVGTIKDDLPGWIVLQTDKAEMSVRKSAITRAEVPSKP